ncbi:MAG: N-acetylmuramoyl-L-alanine amidase [Gloeobacteraceae cyanobacterium ES-bin-316]|nr:N-acetylmuramoyl-L-alanine amidase [Ferruginibacter sp.]
MRPTQQLLILLIFISVLFSCAPKPYSSTNKIYKKQVKALAKSITKIPENTDIADSAKIPAQWVGTINFGLRKPNTVIIHHTAQRSCEQTLTTFTNSKSKVSAHYVICKDGTLHHMLNDYLRAWHAGAGKWGGQADVNSSSIGIEIDNDGKEAFTEAQLNCLLGLLSKLKKNYNIATANFIGHAEIAPTRKVDPNVNFPWKRLAANGYGYWYDDTTGITLPPDFNANYALRIIGYDIADVAAANQAFRRHFISLEKPGELSEEEKKVLFVLMKKYM